MRKPKTSNRIIYLLAELLAGTQVPRSLGATVLGAGTSPWDELRNELHLFGWLDAKAIEVRLREYIQEKDVE